MPCSRPNPLKISVGARGSPLSRAQIEEVAQAVSRYAPHVSLEPIFVETLGDRDLQTSLRTLDKTDFFTRDIDQMQLSKECRLAIHSAKDLPDPLPEGLELVALTQGIDPSDVLVMREGGGLRTLPKHARIGTSSERREAVIRRLLPDCELVDIRGNIGQRLQLLAEQKVDGVVTAEAALIRLGLTDLPRFKLPGKTAFLQGQLALVARDDDEEIRLLFTPLDTRSRWRRVLYLGLDPTLFRRSLPESVEVYHYPVIRTENRPINNPDIQHALAHLDAITHVILTSKTAVHALLQLVSAEQLSDKLLIAVGSATAAHLRPYGLEAALIAEEENAEGIVELLSPDLIRGSVFFWPHAARSRRLIGDFLLVNQIPHYECLLYDTHLHQPFAPPPLEAIDEIVFTSPSTVDGFLVAYHELPDGIRLTAQGPITQLYLDRLLMSGIDKSLRGDGLLDNHSCPPDPMANPPHACTDHAAGSTNQDGRHNPHHQTQ